jgi:hypothetical protein
LKEEINMTTPDLWGKLPTGDTIRTPHAILKEQAALLTEKTNGLLIGEVERQATREWSEVRTDKGSPETFMSILYIVVPALVNYHYAVVAIRYNLTLYPLVLEDLNGLAFQSPHEGTKPCETEREFMAALKQVLSSARLHSVVAGLLAQIRADEIRPKKVTARKQK